jgi:hypothetical protein
MTSKHRPIDRRRGGTTATDDVLGMFEQILALERECACVDADGIDRRLDPVTGKRANLSDKGFIMLSDLGLNRKILWW